MKVYVTKYALTAGIQEKEGEIYDNNEKYFMPNERFSSLISKPFWHENIEDARKHCEDLRSKKIKSLEKQIRVVQALSF